MTMQVVELLDPKDVSLGKVWVTAGKIDGEGRAPEMVRRIRVFDEKFKPVQPDDPRWLRLLCNSFRSPYLRAVLREKP